MYDLERIDKRYLIFARIFLVANRLQTVMDQAMEELTAKQWLVLLSLGMFDEPPTLRQLAAICDSSHQNTRQIVGKLEERGFLTTGQDAEDRRAMRISTTEKWEDWNRDNEKHAADFIDRMFSHLGEPQVAAMSAAQEVLYETLGQMKEEES